MIGRKHRNRSVQQRVLQMLQPHHWEQHLNWQEQLIAHLGLELEVQLTMAELHNLHQLFWQLASSELASRFPAASLVAGSVA